jgi:hypothetical protein
MGLRSVSPAGDVGRAAHNRTVTPVQSVRYWHHPPTLVHARRSANGGGGFRLDGRRFGVHAAIQFDLKLVPNLGCPDTPNTTLGIIRSKMTCQLKERARVSRNGASLLMRTSRHTPSSAPGRGMTQLGPRSCRRDCPQQRLSGPLGIARTSAGLERDRFRWKHRAGRDRLGLSAAYYAKTWTPQPRADLAGSDPSRGQMDDGSKNWPALAAPSFIRRSMNSGLRSSLDE